MQIATVYRADGTTENIRPENGEKFSLAELQHAVGGYIEHVRMAPGNGHAMMWINEDGKQQGLPRNAQASTLLHPSYHDEVVGNAVVVSTA
jgi:hypothetical protein